MDPDCGPKIVLSQGQKNAAKRLHNKLQKERHIHQGRGREGGWSLQRPHCPGRLARDVLHSMKGLWHLQACRGTCHTASQCGTQGGNGPVEPTVSPSAECGHTSYPPPGLPKRERDGMSPAFLVFRHFVPTNVFDAGDPPRLGGQLGECTACCAEHHPIFVPHPRAPRLPRALECPNLGGMGQGGQMGSAPWRQEPL